MNHFFKFFILFMLLFGCSSDDLDPTQHPIHLTIFTINDQHGQLENFSKIKYIVDQAKEETNVLLVCAGDIFSGNPVVDNHEQKGFPIIDVMNQVGFDISVIGNHEFDYGESVLKDRMEQAEFDWVCANVDMSSTEIPEPYEYKTLTAGDLRVCFLGLVETNGKGVANIPLTHPWKVQNIQFERPEDALPRYADIKAQEDADLYVALTHLGHVSYPGELNDFSMAEQFPYFDLVIGGHTNAMLDTSINNTYIFQAGSYLNYLGRIDLTIDQNEIQAKDFELIDLNAYPSEDMEIKALIDEYNATASHLLEVIGYSHLDHQRYQVGCFFTDALAGALGVDISLQNTGGVRSGLDEGDITKREIYEIDPFNNGTIIYTMIVSDIKRLLKESNSAFYYSGIQIEQDGDEILIKNSENMVLDDQYELSLGINDFIPAVYENYFPGTGTNLSMTTAEVIISYLENSEDQVDYPDCVRYFRYE